MPGPTAGRSMPLRGGRKRTSSTPIADSRRRNWSSTTSASAPTISRERAVGASRGRIGARAARQASSPWVKVVSMPLPL